MYHDGGQTNAGLTRLNLLIAFLYSRRLKLRAFVQRSLQIVERYKSFGIRFDRRLLCCCDLQRALRSVLCIKYSLQIDRGANKLGATTTKIYGFYDSCLWDSHLTNNLNFLSIDALDVTYQQDGAGICICIKSTVCTFCSYRNGI